MRSAPTLLADDFAQPNGLCFSADERELFVNDTERGHIRVFDVRGDGTLGGGRVWAERRGRGRGRTRRHEDRQRTATCTAAGRAASTCSTARRAASA